MTKKPFDNINVRKAVIAAFDREALLLTRGGREVGPIAQHYIRPESRASRSPAARRASRVRLHAQREGRPEPGEGVHAQGEGRGGAHLDDGRYTGPGNILTIATNADPGLQTATVAQGQLKEMGFDLNFRKVPQDTLYTRFCNVPGRTT
jgi:peptide/nickel transport system substrate-binding protein